MSLPEIATREDWLVARRELLVAEKELTRSRDALNARRRRLPMVEIVKAYEFVGPERTHSLRDLFGDRRQLIVCHFMFDPRWEEGCSSCSAGADEVSDGLLGHLQARDTRLVFVARAPIAKIEAYRVRRGWTFPWFSSYDSDFNYDFHVTLDESRAPIEYNYRTAAEHRAAGTVGYVEGDQPIEMPGASYFLRVGDRVFHTYSNYARGTEMTGGSYYFLDLTALGRQEDWEEPKGRATAAHAAQPDFAT